MHDPKDDGTNCPSFSQVEMLLAIVSLGLLQKKLILSPAKKTNVAGSGSDMDV